jgi:hypothetical protein
MGIPVHKGLQRRDRRRPGRPGHRGRWHPEGLLTAIRRSHRRARCERLRRVAMARLNCGRASQLRVLSIVIRQRHDTRLRGFSAMIMGPSGGQQRYQQRGTPLVQRGAGAR